MSLVPQAHYLEIDEYRARLEKLKDLKDLGIDPYPHHFSATDSLQNICVEWQDKEIAPFEEANAKKTPFLHLAGRLVLMRAMGKNMFAHIQDDTGRIQLMFARDFTSVKGYEGQENLTACKLIEKKFDLGDIIGVSGYLFRTQKGELTLLASEATLLCKSLLPLADKYSGLHDKQMRYRKRWLDMISSHDVVATFKQRSRLVKEIRDYFFQQDFIEVETPVLQNNYGGAQAKPFTTHLNALNQDMYLRISLEIPLKKLLVGGLPRVFEIGKVFRNEGIDRTHNPEFTMVEAYAAYWDYNDMMVFVENLFEKLTLSLFNTTTVLYDETQIDFKAPWKRLSMLEAILELGGFDARSATDEQLRDHLVSHTKFEAQEIKDLSRGLLIAKLFEELAEPKLIQPTHIIDHPIETTPLCKPHRNPLLKSLGLVERFESFVLGAEICNAYSELNDPLLQRKLLEDQVLAREKGDDEAHPMDEEFLEAICQGMPPAGGVGIGIDRLVMLLSNCHSIRDVLFFPIMRPEMHLETSE
jgi:lysyl-tRNA synthetase class 2